MYISLLGSGLDFTSMVSVRNGQYSTSIVLFAENTIDRVKSSPPLIRGHFYHARSYHYYNFHHQSFLGWFGPRGIATIIFALLTLEETEIAFKDDDSELEHADNVNADIIGAMMFTVVCSVFAHGYTAAPFATMYAKEYARKKSEGKGATMELNQPNIRVRGRGKAYRVSRAMPNAPSMNTGRLRSEIDFFHHDGHGGPGGANHHPSHNDPHSGGGGGEADLAPPRSADDFINIPFTKTANTTLIRKGTLHLESSRSRDNR